MNYIVIFNHYMVHLAESNINGLAGLAEEHVILTKVHHRRHTVHQRLTAAQQQLRRST